MSLGILPPDVDIPDVALRARVTSIFPWMMRLDRVNPESLNSFVGRSPGDIQEELLKSECETGHRVTVLVIDTYLWCWLALHPEVRSILNGLPVQPTFVANILGLDTLVVVEP